MRVLGMKRSSFGNLAPVVLLALGMVLLAGAAWAAGSTAGQSSFGNAAQAGHAQNVAEAAAAKDPAVVAAAARVEEAAAALAAAKALGNPAAIAAAQANLNAAQAAAAQTLAGTITANKEAIASMRAEGMGWGEIAKAMGVHPGVLGLGHTKNKTSMTGKIGKAPKSSEVKGATARGYKESSPMGLGAPGSRGISDKGLGGSKSAQGGKEAIGGIGHGQGSGISASKGEGQADL